MIDFYLSRTGKLTANINGKQIHSGIDPEKEAEKYLLARIKNSATPSLIIILFPGLNYLYNSLKKYFPNTDIITIHLNSEMYNNSVANMQSNKVWHPGSELRLKQFLYNNIREVEVKKVLVYTWEPVVKAFPLEAKKYSDIVEQVLTEYNSNISTTNYFGKKYINNIFRNIIAIEKTAIIQNIQKPVIITSSGPSAENAIPLIKKTRDSIFLIALSSSYSILKYNDIRPDIVISTDPGYYAAVHLDSLEDDGQLICTALTANFGKHDKNPFLVINQGTFIENYFLENCGIPYITIPPNGTVAGSSYFLTAALTKSPVIFIGLDLCANDIKTHCSPHAFENIMFRNPARTNPLLDIYYNQAVTNYTVKNNANPHCRSSMQLKAYNGWFNTVNLGENYYRLNPSGIEIKKMKTLDNKAADELIAASYQDFSGNDNFYTLYLIDNNKHRANVKKLAQQLIHNLEADISDSFREKLVVEYDKNLLYYFNTSEYLDLIDLLLSNSKDVLKKKYCSLTEECITFIKKELTKIEKYE
ncbi:MAG: DUF115 domain-containing protein [Spirochaetes bacterium]|nr:DUF115 domain-containing protein [Spirochaetota bacterium]